MRLREQGCSLCSPLKGAARTVVLRVVSQADRTYFSGSNQLLKSKQKNLPKKGRFSLFLAPRVGFEPTTNRLTADCSTAELSRNNSLEAETGIEPISKDLQSSA